MHWQPLFEFVAAERASSFKNWLNSGSRPCRTENVKVTENCRNQVNKSELRSWWRPAASASKRSAHILTWCSPACETCGRKGSLAWWWLHFLRSFRFPTDVVNLEGRLFQWLIGAIWCPESSGIVCVGWFQWNGYTTGCPETSSSWSSFTFPSELKRRFGELWNDFSAVNILSDVLVHVPKEAHSQHKYLIWTFYISTFQLAVKSQDP